MKFGVNLYDSKRDWAQPHQHPMVVNFEDKMLENVRKIDKSGKKRKLSKGERVLFHEVFEQYLKELFKDQKLWESKEFSLCQMAKKLGENYWASTAITFEVKLIELIGSRDILNEWVWVNEMRFIILTNHSQINFELR